MKALIIFVVVATVLGLASLHARAQGYKSCRVHLANALRDGQALQAIRRAGATIMDQTVPQLISHGKDIYVGEFVYETKPGRPARKLNPSRYAGDTVLYVDVRPARGVLGSESMTQVLRGFKVTSRCYAYAIPESVSPELCEVTEIPQMQGRLSQICNL